MHLLRHYILSLSKGYSLLLRTVRADFPHTAPHLNDFKLSLNIQTIILLYPPVLLPYFCLTSSVLSIFPFWKRFSVLVLHSICFHILHCYYDLIGLLLFHLFYLDFMVLYRKYLFIRRIRDLPGMYLIP